MARFADPALLGSDEDPRGTLDNAMSSGLLADQRTKVSPPLTLRDTSGLLPEHYNGGTMPPSAVPGTDTYEEGVDAASGVQSPQDMVHKISAKLHDLARVKANVAEMVRQGAPIEDID